MKFKRAVSTILCIALFAFVLSVAASGTEKNSNEILPSTWAAVDGLGRTLSTNEDTGSRKDDKFVGMFYWTWHYPWINDHEPITTGSVLDKYPEAVNDFDHPAWNNTYSGRPYFWDEPLYGFYTNTDEYMLRKHAELLADADIDVVFFDTTNGTQVFEQAYRKLLTVWQQAKEEGVDAPQISFVLNFSDKQDIRSKLHFIYDDIYKKSEYSDMFFLWDGKPLLMADVRALDLTQEKDREIYNFFTFRFNEPTYFARDFSLSSDTWGWCSDYPQNRFGKKLFGGTEQMCVSVAQNANENGLSAMNNPIGTVQGRSFTDGAFSYTYSYAGEDIVVDKDIENSLFYGLNFQQQWDYAIKQDPEFIFVTGFNEWIAGRFDEWQGTENAFPDQFSPEYSRDIEPSAGVLKDHYYYQLVENVRCFKGTDPLPATDAEKTIDISGDISQRANIKPEYNHYVGSTKKRDSAGWKGYYYQNDTMRNDIMQAKVAYDRENVYFYVRTADDLTPCTDGAWMRLLIDTDPSGISTNWEGFEYVINRRSPTNGKAALERSLGGTEFEEICKIDFAVKGNVLHLSVPREVLGLTGSELKFNFKWSDNMQSDDIMDFYVSGDVAPGGRFTFVFDSTAQGTTGDTGEKEPCFLDSFLEKLNSFYIEIRKFFKYIS